MFKLLSSALMLSILTAGTLKASETPNPEFIELDIVFNFNGITEECDVKIVSADEEDYITRTTSSEKQNVSVEVRPEMNYTMEVSSTKTGVVKHDFFCTAETLKLKMGVVLQAEVSLDGERLGVQSTVMTPSSTNQKIRLNQACTKMKKALGFDNVQAVSKVYFFHQAEQMRQFIASQDLRFEFNENASVHYLKTPRMSNMDIANYETLVNHSFSDVSKWTGENVTDTSLDELEEVPNDNEESYVAPAASPKANDEIYFGVQLGSFQKEITNPEALFQTNSMLSFITENGTYKYMSGTYKTYEEAEMHKAELTQMGKEGVFIIAVQNDKKIPLREAMIMAMEKGELE